MCGRFTESLDAQQFRNLTNVPPPPGWAPRYNVSPGSLIPILRLSPESRLELVELRWGLIPGWVSDPAVGRTMNNAPAESLEEKPSFAASFIRRRCLVPADGFYVWLHAGQKKTSVYFRFTRPLAMAAIWDSWTSTRGESIETAAIVTTRSNAVVGHVHNRMPVLLDALGRARWMNSTATKAELRPLLQPAPESFLKRHAVNNTRAPIVSAVEQVEAFATVYR